MYQAQRPELGRVVGQSNQFLSLVDFHLKGGVGQREIRR